MLLIFCSASESRSRPDIGMQYLKAYATTTALHHRYIYMYIIIHKASEWQTARGEFNSASAISSVFAMLGCISACFQNGFC